MSGKTNVTADAYEHASLDPESFWAAQAERLSWSRRWDRVLDWDRPPHAEWFVGGRLNAAYNCVDRHVEAGNGDRVAIHWVGESTGETRDITYADLKAAVSKAANALLELGVEAGDRVAIYLPMIPEAIIAMLACARIGALHAVVFDGFSAAALGARIADCGARVVITADGGYRRGAVYGVKPTLDSALGRLGDLSPVQHVLVVRRTGQRVAFDDSVDVWWHDLVEVSSSEHTPEAFDAEHPLFLIYTSGTTGKPKGILHTTGGYLTQTAYTHWAVFDLKPETDVYWCTADIGWIAGHSYIVYGPLANGATQVLYEGTPDHPAPGRWWQVVQRYRVSILYTAPSAVRACMKQSREVPDRHDLSSLRILGSAGEALDPTTYAWYRSAIGADRAHVVDTWGQTETGSALISPLPGLRSAKPGSVLTALPGITVDVVDDQGRTARPGSPGLLVITSPWPSMLRTVWGDGERYMATYWSLFGEQGFFFTGDGAVRDEDGDLWLLGRVDDVMKVRGHRLSTGEIESALVTHPLVAEVAVVGANDPETGQAAMAYVVLRDDAGPARAELLDELAAHVGAVVGDIARPRTVSVMAELPKTRSGKIMRRLLRSVAEQRTVRTTGTPADPGAHLTHGPPRHGSQQPSTPSVKVQSCIG